MTELQAIILSIVEGLTEYLPISSTGHMIIASALMGINESSFTKDFTVIVQFGAILSVLVLYHRRFRTGLSFYVKLFAGFLPAAIVGFLLKNKIDAVLGDVRVVAIALVIGGVILIFIDLIFAVQEERLETSGRGTINQLTLVQATLIGFVQCIAFIPGVSRSAATIIGGLGAKLTRKAAAEFSFFLAVPTLSAACAYKLLKTHNILAPENLRILLIGNVISFIVGLLTIRAFVGFLTRRGFFIFGVYRILLGGAILALLRAGYELRLM